ncbi:MAG: tripartite tricarboxylate transporter TctB family protein [Rhodospirillales bacterium]
MADKAASPENRADWIRTNQGVGVVITALIIVLLIYLSQQEWVFQRLRDGFQLGFFTVVSAFTMLLCSVAMIFDGFKNKTDKEMSAMNRLDFIMPVIVVAVCYIYFLLAWRYDFLLVTPIFLAAGIYSFGIRPLRTVIIGGIVITLTIFGLFRLIGIYLPSYIIPA